MKTFLFCLGEWCYAMADIHDSDWFFGAINCGWLYGMKHYKGLNYD